VIQVYKELLASVRNAPTVKSIKDPNSIGSDWGQKDRPFREVLGATFNVDATRPLLRSVERPLNEAYAVLSSAWIILGRDDVEPLLKHNPRGSQFSADGFTLSGAFGARLRKGFDQIEATIALLRRDPTSRRAICYMGRVQDLAIMGRDFPCASAVQFFVRDGLLCTVLYMRSQSLFGVFPYDLVNFSYLQTYMAHRLSLPPGTFIFVCGSLHVYEAELPRIERFLREDEAHFAAAPPLPWETLDETFSTWVDDPKGIFLSSFVRDEK
jgi:thymidylate synthase